VVHAALIGYLEDREEEDWRWFMESLKSDVYDTQGGTTLEGIHCGVMAGTLSIIVDDFAGLQIEPNTLYVRPRLPEHWDRVSFSVKFREALFTVTAGRRNVVVSCEGSCPQPVEVHLDGTVHRLEPGNKVEADVSGTGTEA
jgi:trehalose/maltose hydrolase-like predicted phosphorylase